MEAEGGKESPTKEVKKCYKIQTQYNNVLMVAFGTPWYQLAPPQYKQFASRNGWIRRTGQLVRHTTGFWITATHESTYGFVCGRVVLNHHENSSVTAAFCRSQSALGWGICLSFYYAFLKEWPQHPMTAWKKEEKIWHIATPAFTKSILVNEMSAVTTLVEAANAFFS